MSGICGLFNLDDALVAETELRAMTAMLEKRGPEGTGRWRDGSVGLGHTLLATTPELLFEKQPFTHADTGCVITADVRLDNRQELLDAFGLTARRDSTGDAELILRAYLEWGEDCVDRLLGDFAFAIHDPGQQRLFCARDHFGMRPFYYHHAPGKRFVFASDARAILVLPQVPYRINEGRVADFLVPQLEWIDYTSTFYADVYRLPPGHKASVSPDRLEVAEYWKPEPGPALGPMSDDDLAQGFLEVLTRAVEARLRAPAGSAGSMLSGGMDSGSVVAVGKEILDASGNGPLATYSGVQYRDSDCAESRAIYASLTEPLIAPTLVHPDAVHQDFEYLISDIEEPFDGEFMILKSIYRVAQKEGRRVLLDGAGGDVVLAEGSYIVRLLRRGQLRSAMSEISGQCKIWELRSRIPYLLQYLRAAFLPDVVKRPLRPVRNRLRIRNYVEESLISSEFADRVNIADRFAHMRQMFPGTWTSDYAVERSNAILPNMTAGRERYARLAAGCAAEARDPFLDKRLVDYCSRLPGHVRMQDGWPKMILREVMANRLPDEVRWTRRKPHLGWIFNAAVTRQAVNLGELDLTRLEEGLRDYVDMGDLSQAWREFRDGTYREPIHSAYMLSIWLCETANRPVVSDSKVG